MAADRRSLSGRHGSRRKQLPSGCPPVRNTTALMLTKPHRQHSVRQTLGCMYPNERSLYHAQSIKPGRYGPLMDLLFIRWYGGSCALRFSESVAASLSRRGGFGVRPHSACFIIVVWLLGAKQPPTKPSEANFHTKGRSATDRTWLGLATQR